MIDKLIKLCLENKFIVLAVTSMMIGWGILVAPFDWELGKELRDPVPVDAIPDIGENQQIVFTNWPGRSPQDIEDQISYPMTVALLGIPDVKTVRSFSMFGFSTVYVIFKEEAGFYWSRSRILEKLNSLPPGTLPDGVTPMLGPDATSLGQVFWYTLEGYDQKGAVTGGWDLHELRSAQDWQVRFPLMGVDGVSEVASIGGFVQEYQIDVDPEALRYYGISLNQVFQAVSKSNIDVGARTMEINNVEYFIRGIGFIKSLGDIESVALKETDNVTVTLKDVANVTLGPAARRGVLDKEGAEAVGGVVVARFGANPLAVINRVKEKITAIEGSLPSKVLADGTVSKLKIVPFYDRTRLIRETLNTLNTALIQQLLITVIVVLVMVLHLRSSLIISSMLPLAVLFTFVAMKVFGVDANIVSLSGIAIAIGTIVDMGIVMCENIYTRLRDNDGKHPSIEVVYKASCEVGSAVVTAVATTIIGFLPVFTLQASEGKLFRPLAFTKTFVLIASVIIALTLVPVLAHLFFRGGRTTKLFSGPRGRAITLTGNLLLALAVSILLASNWLPLGPVKGLFVNSLFVALIIGLLLGMFYLFQKFYPSLLAMCLRFKLIFLCLPLLVVFAGLCIYSNVGQEFMPQLDEGAFLYMPTVMPHASIGEARDVLGKQDMLMAIVPEIDSVVGKIGRVDSPLDPAPISMMETVVNYKSEFLTDEKGRIVSFEFDSSKNDFFRDEKGEPLDAPDGKPYVVKGEFKRDDYGQLVPDKYGAPFRLWRPALDTKLNDGREAWKGVNSPQDIWDILVDAARVPGATSAPFLQPISARIVMLQSGMRAPIGIKVKGQSLREIEQTSLDIERLLKGSDLKSLEKTAVFADRIVGKPYVEIRVDREAATRYGLNVLDIQSVIEMAVGGKVVTNTVEGRERYAVRVRYQREKHNSLDELSKVLVYNPKGVTVPLGQVADIKYVKGPQNIKSEDTFLLSYVLLDKKSGYSEIDTVEEVKSWLEYNVSEFEKSFAARTEKLGRPLTEYERASLSGLDLRGCNIEFSGNYQNQQRASRRLMIILPLALGLIFLILYAQFKAISKSLIIFSGIAVAWGGGFIMIWLYGQDWFFNFSLFGVEMRELFQIETVYLSVAVWVGFLALFGIATDDGVVMGTYLNQIFDEEKPADKKAIRDAVLKAGKRRVRPCLMTTATTILALLPVLTSSGRGADIMIPMAIPSFGGMVIEILTMLVVPVMYCSLAELKLFWHAKFGRK